MDEVVAYLNGEWVPRSTLSLPITDAGVMLGATVVEQLRTFDGRLFRYAEHLSRLGRSLKIAGIDAGLSINEIGKIGSDLVARNHQFLGKGDDLGLTIFITPGLYPSTESEPSRPTVCIHTQPLVLAPLVDAFCRGQSVVITDIVQVPAQCWPPELKCRSRMHYFLADQKAARLDSAARALTLDSEGFIAEASTANIVAFFEGEGLVSPLREQILQGISLEVLVEMASELGIPFTYQSITPDRLRSADELFLCSTTPCLLPVTKVDLQPVGSGKVGEMFGRLMQAWCDLAGLDIVAQAKRFATR